MEENTVQENSEEINEVTEVAETEKLKLELEETADRYKRLMAEFDNYKKRSAKEREGLYNSLLSDIVSSVLPVVDNLEKAVATKTEDENYKQGVEMVHKQLLDTLSNLGVEQIKAVGETFNPEYHEAVSSVQDDELGEKVIRHSMVVVAN